MKNLFIYIGVALIVAATVISQFTGIEIAEYVKLAGFAVGLASCMLGIVKTAEKKTWKPFVSIIGITLGTMLLVFAGFVEGQIVTLITAVAGLVVLIISILPAFIKKK